MCSRRNYLLEVFPTGGSFPLNIHPSESYSGDGKLLQEENGENGKYCASYYLFTYLHFSYFSSSIFVGRKNGRKVSFHDDRRLEEKALQGTSSVTKFLKLEMTRDGFPYLT